MSAATLSLLIDGQRHTVAAGISLLAALEGLSPVLRYSVSGAPRGGFCAMGLCQECRVSVDGQPGVLACLTLVREGMQVQRGGPAR